MSPRTVLYGLRNTRKQATDQQCPRPRPHTTAHWHRMHTGCDRQAAARIPIAFAPGTPALAFPAVSSPEACATPALRPWVIVVWVPVPGRYPTTLNKTTSPVDGEAVGRAAPSGLMMPYVRYTPYSQHSRLRVRPGPNDCLVQGIKSTPAASDRLQTLQNRRLATVSS